MAESYFNLPPALPLPATDMPGRSTVNLADVSQDVSALARHALEAGFVQHDGPSHYLPKPKHLGWFCWEWQLIDTAPQTPVVLATGRAWTEDRAWARRRKVYDALLEEAATARTNLRDRRDDGLVDE